MLKRISRRYKINVLVGDQSNEVVLKRSSVILNISGIEMDQSNEVVLKPLVLMSVGESLLRRISQTKSC